MPRFLANSFFDLKVKILWEGHKIWKNLPLVLTKQLFLLSSVKTSGRFFQNFVAFLEKLNFKNKCFTSFLFGSKDDSEKFLISTYCQVRLYKVRYLSKLYTPSTLNIDFIQWHTQLNMCAVKLITHDLIHDFHFTF